MVGPRGRIALLAAACAIAWGAARAAGPSRHPSGDALDGHARPRALAWDAREGRLYVALSTADALAVVDPAVPRVEARVDVCRFPDAVVALPGAARSSRAASSRGCDASPATAPAAGGSGASRPGRRAARGARALAGRRARLRRVACDGRRRRRVGRPFASGRGRRRAGAHGPLAARAARRARGRAAGRARRAAAGEQLRRAPCDR